MKENPRIKIRDLDSGGCPKLAFVNGRPGLRGALFPLRVACLRVVLLAQSTSCPPGALNARGRRKEVLEARGQRPALGAPRLGSGGAQDCRRPGLALGARWRQGRGHRRAPGTSA